MPDDDLDNLEKIADSVRMKGNEPGRDLRGLKTTHMKGIRKWQSKSFRNKLKQMQAANLTYRKNRKP